MFKYNDPKSGKEFTVKQITNISEVNSILQFWKNEAGWNATEEKVTSDFTIRMNNGCCFAAFDNQKAAGAIFGFIDHIAATSEYSASERGWYVLPEYRGSGIGKVLTVVFEAWGKANNASYAVFNVSDAGSGNKEIARARLEKNGYHVAAYDMIKRI